MSFGSIVEFFESISVLHEFILNSNEISTKGFHSMEISINCGPFIFVKPIWWFVRNFEFTNITGQEEFIFILLQFIVTNKNISGQQEWEKKFVNFE